MTLTETLSLFHEPSDPIEIRFLGVERPGRTYAGWITIADASRVASQVAALERLAEGVYFTPHKLNPEVMSRSKVGHFGPVRRNAKGETTPRLTHDEDVLERRYLIIDVDPVRAVGFEKCSATDSEKSEAREVANRVIGILRELSFVDPLLVDSGNGYHAYYRMPVPMPGGKMIDTQADYLGRILRALAHQCDTPGAKIDAAVYNPARIMKLPGTWSKKGPDTSDRPHRQSQILDVPTTWGNNAGNQVYNRSL